MVAAVVVVVVLVVVVVVFPCRQSDNDEPDYDYDYDYESWYESDESEDDLATESGDETEWVRMPKAKHRRYY